MEFNRAALLFNSYVDFSVKLEDCGFNSLQNYRLTLTCQDLKDLKSFLIVTQK
jgi:hypothetical protein